MSLRKSGTVALVGRPNVGKSSLFNCLCQSRDALVHNRPGLTRDRQYGIAKVFDNASVTLIDTGGLLDDAEVAPLIDEQVETAIKEADVTLFIVDSTSGITPSDEIIAARLRKLNVKLLVFANKIDVLPIDQREVNVEFAQLGFGDVPGVSATTRYGLDNLITHVSDWLPVRETAPIDPDSKVVAILGRPNVGKSTLVNTLTGSNRCVVFDQPGTTRDAIHVGVQREESKYVFIDTAGIRRKGKVSDVIEKFSIVKALAAMQEASVALLVIDASEGIVDQDLHLINYAMDAGTGMILVANKWDLLSGDRREQFRNELSRRLRFADWVKVRPASALKGMNIGSLFDEINRVWAAGVFDVTTMHLNNELAASIRSHAPPMVRNRAIKLRYIHKTGAHPPSVLIHGNQTKHIPASYIRYLENRLRKKFNLYGWPISVSFKTSTNPFRYRKNELSDSQRRKRTRVIRHRKAN